MEYSLEQFQNQLVKCFDYFYPTRDSNLTQKPDNKVLKQTLENSSGVVFLCDFPNKSYDFVSDNVESILGYSPAEFVENGVTLGFTLYPSHQYSTIIESIMPGMFNSFNEYGLLGMAKDIRVSYTSLIRCRDNTYRWFLQQITVVETDENNMPIKALKLLIDIHEFYKSNIIDFHISKRDASGVYQVVFSEEYSTEEPSVILSNRELEVLQLISEGLSSKQIADQLCISENTVNNHRKNMLHRSESKSMNELLKLAITSKIIS